jgi:predicted HTH domain antitoxin
MILEYGNEAFGIAVSLLRAANLEGRDLSLEAARLLALELYREDNVSLERTAELCQTPLELFMDFVAKHGVPPCDTATRIWNRSGGRPTVPKRNVIQRRPHCSAT